MSWSFLVHCFTIWSTEPTVLGYRLHGMWGKFLTILVCAMGPQEEAQQWAQHIGLQQLQGDWNLHSLQNLTNATNILSVSYNYLAGIPPLRKSEYHMPPTGGPGRIKTASHLETQRVCISGHWFYLPNIILYFFQVQITRTWNSSSDTHFILIFIPTFHSSRGLKVDWNSLLPSFFLSLQLPFCDIY